MRRTRWSVGKRQQLCPCISTWKIENDVQNSLRSSVGLERPLNTRKVCGSIPHANIFLFLQLTDRRRRRRRRRQRRRQRHFAFFQSQPLAPPLSLPLPRRIRDGTDKLRRTSACVLRRRGNGDDNVSYFLFFLLLGLDLFNLERRREKKNSLPTSPLSSSITRSLSSPRQTRNEKPLPSFPAFSLKATARAKETETRKKRKKEKQNASLSLRTE